MSDRKLNVILTAKDEMSKIITKAGGAIKENLKSISAAGAVAATGMIAFGKSALEAYSGAEKSQAALENAVIGVSKGTKEQVKAINEAAEALQKKAGVDGDAIVMGAAQLSTFGLQSESVVKLTKSLTDLTVNQAGLNAGTAEYEASANVMAKALNGQFGALEKSGIRFTEAQQNMILYGTEAEKVTALQEGLAQNLKYTTDNAAASDVQMAKLGASFGEISESIGAALAPALAMLSAKLVPVFDMMANWAGQHPGLIAGIIAITAGVGGLMALLWPLSVAIGAVSTAMAFLAANPIVLVIAGLAAVGVAIYVLITQWDAVKVKALEVWESIKGAIGIAVDFIVEKFNVFKEQIGQVWENIKQRISEKVNAIKESLNAFIESIKSVFSLGFENLKLSWSEFWDSLKGAASAAVEGIKGVIQGIIGAIGLAIDKLVDLANKAKSMVGMGAGAVAKGSSTSGKRASGGNFYAGQTMLVGEKGPELATFSQSGSIIPNNKMGGGITLNVNVTGNTVLGGSIKQFSQMVGDEIINSLRLQTKLS